MKRVMSTRKCAAAGISVANHRCHCRLTLVNILLRILLGDRDDSVLSRSRWVSGVRGPDRVLEQLVGVLLLDDHSQGLEDISGVIDQDPALGGELVDRDGRVADGVLERLVDLLVVGHSADVSKCLAGATLGGSPIVEGLDDAPELHLSLDIGVELVSSRGSGDGHAARVGAELGLSRHSGRE